MKKLIFKAYKNKIWRLLNNLKQKVVEFDIKPAKSTLAVNLAIAAQAYKDNDYVTCDKILRDLLRRHPGNRSVILKTLELYDYLRLRDAELRIARYAARYHPNDYTILHMAGRVCAKAGNYRESARYYKRALKVYPDAPSTHHFFHAVSGKKLVQPQHSYIVDLFDGYANTFDKHLVGALKYQGHLKLAAMLKSQGEIQTGYVVDLGCGTGLLGQALKEHFAISKLAGVDLSAKMLDQCREKKLYDTLHKDDFVTYMQNAQPGVDLIVSSDALTYLGDLNPIFSHSQRTLNQGGFLAFTVEKGRFGTYKLCRTGRYQHSPNYIKSLYKRYLFSKMYAQTIELRKESGNMVEGYLVLIQK